MIRLTGDRATAARHILAVTLLDRHVHMSRFIHDIPVLNNLTIRDEHGDVHYDEKAFDDWAWSSGELSVVAFLRFLAGNPCSFSELTQGDEATARALAEGFGLALRVPVTVTPVVAW